MKRDTRRGVREDEKGKREIGRQTKGGGREGEREMERVREIMRERDRGRCRGEREVGKKGRDMSLERGRKKYGFGRE